MIEDNLIKVVRKFLIGQTFEVDGFDYRFLKVEPYELGDKAAFRFEVNVDLPSKTNSYVVAKFDGDIEKILINLWKYFGMQFSYSIDKIYVNGKLKNDKDIYVSPQKLKEIVTTINSEIKRVYVRSKEINIDFNPSFKLLDYYMSDVNMTFTFEVGVSEIRSEGKPIQPKMDTIDDLASSLWEDMTDNDSLRTDAEDIIYVVLEPEFRVGNMDDLYYSVNFNVGKIDGIYTDPKSWGGYLKKEYFT